MASATYVALFRGINVGGKNMLPMKDLVAMFTATGARDVRSFIQSGNIVFAADKEVARRAPGVVSTAIESRFGFRAPIVVRSALELAAAVRDNPFLESGADVDALHVGFLADKPSSKSVAGLDAKRSPPDSFVVRGREVYLCCPGGMARTKLTNAYFDSKLETTSTMRNWRTVLKLVELAAM